MASELIQVERVLQQRDVDAALYLLERLLGASDQNLGDRRKTLQRLQRKIARRRSLTQVDRQVVVQAYHEIIG